MIYSNNASPTHRMQDSCFFITSKAKLLRMRHFMYKKNTKKLEKWKYVTEKKGCKCLFSLSPDVSRKFIIKTRSLCILHQISIIRFISHFNKGDLRVLTLSGINIWGGSESRSSCFI